jgi:extracellular factor (EF) 3-hydroxypalmitic acid methyl ester biosynthesis protein
MLTNVAALAESLDFDRWSADLRDGSSFEGVLNEMVYRAWLLREELPAPMWKETAAEFQSQTLHRRLLECPLHDRAYSKPRGYAGDAPMLDYIYRLTPAPAGTSEFGRRVLAWALDCGSSCSVRARRDELALVIDETADRVRRPRILSLACGHLREAMRSESVRAGKAGELIAFDQDAESLEVIARGRYQGVTPMRGSVRGLLAGDVVFEDLDLIYSAGLYDYLPDPAATRLNQLLFSMLRPGGKLLVANLAPNLIDAAYMEMCMDWWLIYRDERGCENFLSAIEPRHPRRFYRDPFGNVVFAEVTKRPL